MVRMEVEQAETARRLELDEVQYSRVIHTLGREGVEALRRSRILIIGCGGVGAEIAKNVILCGVASVGLVDEGAVRAVDLGATFLLSQGDVGQNRAFSTANALKDLNPDASVEVFSCCDIEVHLKKFSVVVATDGTVPFLVKLNQLCRSSAIAFVSARARGVFASVFCDFGDNFLVRDDSGTPPFNVVIESITQDFPATVTVVEEQRHGLQDGDEVVFHGVRGMEELNRSLPVAVNVTGSHSFTILVDTRQFGRYTSGGYFYKVKASRTVQFLPLEEALVAPQFCAHDPAKQQHVLDLHVAFQAVETFERIKCIDSHFVNPVAIKDEEIDEVLLLARQAAAHISVPMSNDCTPISSAFGDERWHSTSLNYKTDTEVDGEAYGDIVNGQTKDKTTLTGEQIAEANTNTRPAKTHAEINGHIVELVALEAHVEIGPIVSIAGGIAAQEVIKAVTGVFFPVHQWLYIDAIECLPSVTPCFQERSACDSRYDSYVAIFGKDLQKKLGHGQWLVVGAGSIGCEVMKNLVLMGVGCSPNGSITVSDMDNVSKPNLSNQVLYKIDDLGRLKTASASRALRKINPAAQVRALNLKFSTEAENIFDSSFFDSISGVLSALDTSSSRLYLDARCVAYQKPMIDGGKHGTRGSVQVFVPFCSEMYASTRDPPEHRETPICTIKNFPYASEHTLQWAVELFENLFKQRPDDVNAYLSNRDFQESLKMSTTPARYQILEMLRDALVKYKPLSFEACIEWARLQFEEMFSNNIKQLCYNFPIDMRTTAGAPFWSGTKRLPRALDFDAEDPLHMDFVIAAANLQATVYGLRGCTDHNHFMQILQKTDIPVFKPKEGVKIALSDNDLPSSTQGKARTTTGDCDVASSSDILSQLPTPATLVGYRLSPLNFDKDDEGKFHANFVHSAANLRSQNYGIGYSDKLQARLIGGRTIPSIITTASVVGGLMCLEVFKILQEKPLEEYRHSYFNLSLPLFISAQPIKAVENKVIRTQKEPLLWTLWDKFEMDCVGMSLQTFLAEFKQEHGLEEEKEAEHEKGEEDVEAEEGEETEAEMETEAEANEDKEAEDEEEVEEKEADQEDASNRSTEEFEAGSSTSDRVNMIMYGKSLLYAEFLNKKKLQERMTLTLLELVLNVGKVTIPTTENKLILSLTCTDAGDLDVEVPDVIIRVR